MCRKVRLVIIVLSLFMPFMLKSDEMRSWALSQEDKTYAISDYQPNDKCSPATNGKFYELMVKVKPKIEKVKTYWLEKENMNWPEETNNWHFGYLNEEKTVPLPVIFRTPYLSLEENNYQGKYYWGADNMTLLVFNLLNSPVQSSLEFYLASYKETRKERRLEVCVNGKVVGTTKVPGKEEFSVVKIKNIYLKPGINKIKFILPENKDSIEGETKKTLKESGIKFKDFKFIDLVVQKKQKIDETTQNLLHYPQKEGLDIMFFSVTPAMLTRDLDVYLEEFPMFNLEAEFKQNGNARLIISLGIDYTGDEVVDGYLNLDAGGEYNLLELAQKQWPMMDGYEKGKLKLKRISLLLIPTGPKSQRGQVNILRLKNLNLYNDNSLLILNKKFNKNELIFKNISVDSHFLYDENFRKEEEAARIFAYFDVGPKRIKTAKFSENEIEGKEKAEEETQVFVPLGKLDWRNYPYFSFEYKLDNPQIQDIQLALLSEEQGVDKIINLAEGQYKRSAESIDLNLKNLVKEGQVLKDLVIRLKRNDGIDSIPTVESNWYQFQLSNLKLYEKFPYPIKTVQTKEQFLTLIQNVNPSLIKIDHNIFRLDDFTSWQNKENLEDLTLAKNIELAKGKHNYRNEENSHFIIKGTVIKTAESNQENKEAGNPKISFKKINPTKYLVTAEGANKPFWLVFSETFNKDWKIYADKNYNYHHGQKEGQTNYPVKFTPADIKYFFTKPLNIRHSLVNGYANGWYIEPEKLGLGANFSFIVYFYPQSFFYLGLGISILTMFGCLIYLISNYLRGNI